MKISKVVKLLPELAESFTVKKVIDILFEGFP